MVEQSGSVGFHGKGGRGSLANQKVLFSMQEGGKEEEGLSCFLSSPLLSQAQTPRVGGGRKTEEEAGTLHKKGLRSHHPTHSLGGGGGGGGVSPDRGGGQGVNDPEEEKGGNCSRRPTGGMV